MASLTIKNLGKKFGGTAAVRDVSLNIAEGEFIVLVGPSGCGKTTTLRMIAGLETIDSGEVFMDGVCINDLVARERDMAMVFQRYSLYPHLSVYENIAFGLHARGYPGAEIKKKVREMSEILHIEHLLKRRPQQLSGGEQQRVAIGRALVRSPKVYLMDEPLSNLDAKLRLDMRTEIKRLHQELGITTVYVTHDQAEAMSLGDRMVVMNSGEVVQVGCPIEVYRYPRHSFVASFLGSPAMNLVAGRLVSAEPGLRFQNSSLALDLPGSLIENLNINSLSREDEYLLGIRPEHLRPGPGPAGKVLVVEMLGSETLIQVGFGDQSLRLKTTALRVPSQGERITCEFVPEHLHLFHRSSGISVTFSPENNNGHYC